jgi:hypothetical protein
MGAGVRGRSPLLGEGIRRPVRLARLGIGIISKSAQKDGTSIVHQCPLVLLKLKYVKNEIF